MPKISVIVPVYRCEKYLGECIESILGQTFKDFELLLLDDGSLTVRVRYAMRMHGRTAA